ncbi:MAG TPA: DUF748 domain-containing protein [Bacteroidales bacterium]|nr:DUF748 domain-containing protein [Bacteroidales bacterium]
MHSRYERRHGRLLLKSIVIILGIIILLILIASPLTKYLAQKYDVRFTGREITIARAFVNPVAGSLSLTDFRMYGPNGDSVFVYAHKFKTNISILKLIAGVYEVSRISLVDPEVIITRDDTVFNFSDLIKKFTAGADTTKKEKITKFRIKNISLSDGKIQYREKKIPFSITLSEINFDSPGVSWDTDTITGIFSLAPGLGNFSGNFMFNQKSFDYRASLYLSGFQIGQFKPYLDALAGKGNIAAILNFKINADGNAKQLMNAHANGNFDVRDFHFGADPDRDYMSVNRFLVSFRDINPGEKRFYFDSVLIEKPYILYEKYDTLDNFRRMFSTMLAKQSAEHVKDKTDTTTLFSGFSGSDYYLLSFALTDGKLEFNDYSLAEKFSMSVNPLTIKADTIDKSKRRVKMQFEGKINPYGTFASTLSMNPENEKNFDFKYNFRNIAATMFNPYIVTYSSYQLDHGTIEMHGDWSVRNGNIDALNHFTVINPQDTRRVKGKDAKRVPLPLIMAFVRERGSFIDYQIPVKGNLNDPSFKLHDVITDILRNILVKPPTTPYRLEVRNVENVVEKTLTVKWKMRQYRIEEGQDKFMKRIAGFLKDNPEANITVQPVFHEEKEKENILLFEARKKYFLNSRKNGSVKLSEDDSMKVEKINVRDKNFMKYLNSSIKNSELLTLPEKCYRLTGKDVVDNKYNDLMQKRREAFLESFRENKSIDRVDILEPVSRIPYNWFSFYDIRYKGDIPESLSKAFNDLYNINTEPPRRRFFNPPVRK